MPPYFQSFIRRKININFDANGFAAEIKLRAAATDISSTLLRPADSGHIDGHL